MLELANRVAEAEVRAARLEWERDQARCELESLRRALPGGEAASESNGRHRRWWWWPVLRA